MRSASFCAALLFLTALPGQALAGPRPPVQGPTLVLVSKTGEERAIEVGDLAFVFYERIYYDRRAPRSEGTGGRRIEVEDRRRECRCLFLDDWSKIKFRKLRQIEITYPSGERTARLRLTHRDGRLREVPVEALFGGSGPWPPRFAATLDGVHQEFLLGREGGDGEVEEWPEERLVRILLMRPRLAPPKSPSRRR